MTGAQKEKIQRFIDDKVMSDSVREVLEQVVIRPKSREVTYLAGQMIALEILKEAWKELLKNANQNETEKKDIVQVGI